MSGHLQLDHGWCIRLSNLSARPPTLWKGIGLVHRGLAATSSRPRMVLLHISITMAFGDLVLTRIRRVASFLSSPRVSPTCACYAVQCALRRGKPIRPA